MCLYSVPWLRWQLRHWTVRFLLRGSLYFSPIGCEECLSQSWQLPHISTTSALANMSGASEPWGSWQALHWPPCTGSCLVGESSCRLMVSAWQAPHTFTMFPFTRPFCDEACGL